MSSLNRRGLLAAVVVAAPLVVAGVPAASATAKPAISGGLTQPVFSYADAIREHVRVQSPVDSDGDGKKDLVRVDIIRPKESDSGLKVPVIMHESPYYDNPGVGYELDHKTYDANGNVTKFPLAYDNYFVPRGYAFLAVDMIGTRLSEGCPSSYGASDVLGGKAVVDWLNGRASAYDDQGEPVKASWTTGRTGMIGHSYEGALGAAVAGTGVRGLETIVNISGYTSGYENSRINGTLSWFAGQASWQAERVAADPGRCAAVSAKLLEDSDDATGNYNAYWDERNYRTGTVSKARNVRASVFSVMGMHDRNVVGSQFSEWWAALPRDVRRKAWVTQYGHVDPFWARREVWMDTLHQWFDHELMGVANDIMRQPRVDVQLGPDRWITQADWPAPTRTATLRPQRDGSLGTKPSTGTGSYLDLAKSEVAMATDPATTNPNRLAFLTPPLQKATRLSGTPSVSLRLKLDKPTANLGVLLVDYGTDTRITHERTATAAEGLRFIGGEDCIGQASADDDGCYRRAADNTATSDFQVVTRGILDAQNHKSLSRSTPLTPGKSYRITWKMLPQDYEFKAGHRLGLVLTGANDDFNLDESGNGSGTDVEPGTGANVSIDLAGTSISLPLVTGTPNM
ncbi:CocE/NonD family hydrolase [Nonomuraea sp. 3-1Str]|uniref:CocE/NonD family hydrolase n=1 Tax=Nonomuraea sp. 3-1Str TaxID=2929801 RepID=UPI002866EEC2|nr:CocE/NonD family hydrolase [Nonomuraea sp. 3-1Str]MDR8412808.1 CocE/NonD family hydrolase [Nonomuraea sp. 3-1Str]